MSNIEQKRFAVAREANYISGLVAKMAAGHNFDKEEFKLRLKAFEVAKEDLANDEARERAVQTIPVMRPSLMAATLVLHPVSPLRQ